MKKNLIKIIASILCSAFVLTSVSCSDKQTEQKDSGTQTAVVAGEYLYKGGISEYSIVIRDNASYYETFAATELADNLQKATGNSLPILTESTVKDSSRVISLGHTKLWDEKVGLTLNSEEIINSGYYIKTVGTSVYISCPDGTSGSGVLYGVYDFLIDTIDYEFFAADEIYYNRTQEIPLYNYQ